MKGEGSLRAGRGEATRQKLLEEGLRLFATKGYASVSTREIAQAAAVNHAAIGFHFQGKEGLYTAVIDAVLKRLHDIVDPLVKVIDMRVEACSGDKTALRQIIIDAVEQFIMATMRSKRSQWISIILQREYVDPSYAFERLYSDIIEHVLKSFEKLVIISHDNNIERNIVQVMTYAMMLQLTSMGRDRAIFHKYFNQTTDINDTLQTLTSIVAKGIFGILDI